MKYGIVKSILSSNFIVFPTVKDAQDWAKQANAECFYERPEFFAKECDDPFMTFEKFIQIPEFQGW